LKILALWIAVDNFIVLLIFFFVFMEFYQSVEDNLVQD